MLQLHLSNMTCEGCVRSVTRAVHKVAPAASVAVDLPSGAVTIEGAADPAPIVEAIKRAGYDVALRDDAA